MSKRTKMVVYKNTRVTILIYESQNHALNSKKSDVLQVGEMKNIRKVEEKTCRDRIGNKKQTASVFLFNELLQ